MSHEQANSPGLFDALNIFRRRFRYVVSATLLGGAVAGVFFWNLEPSYESVASFLIDLPEDLPDRTGDATDEGVGPSDDMLADNVFIAESRAVIAAALQRVGEDVQASIHNCLEDDQTDVEYIEENLRVTRGGEGQLRNARVITLRLRHNDPAECAIILNAIISSYEEFRDEQSRETGDQAIEMCQEELAKSKQRLDNVIATYEGFRSETRELLGNQVDRINPYQEEVKKWNESLAEIRAQKIETRSRIETVRRLLSQEVEDEYGIGRVELLAEIAGITGRPEMVEAVKVEVNEHWQMKLRLRDLLQQYGSGHPW